jgi:hypothetical protein
MSSVQSGSSKQPLRRFVSAAPFPRDIFSYTVVSEPYPHEVLIPVAGANSRNCPAGRVLRESGKKLYPGVNKAIKTYMVGVIDTQSGISGFIDPNSPLFALYSTDLPAVFKDGRDPGPQGKVDVGPPLYTNGNLYVAGNGVVDGTLRTNILYANDAIIDTGSFSTMTGAELDVDQATVSSLLGGNLIVSSTESQTVLASTIQSGHVDGITGRFEQLEISTFSARSGVVYSVLYVGNLSTANTSANTITTSHMDARTITTHYMDASTIEVSSLAVNQELAASSMYSINLRGVNGKIFNLETSTIIVSTLCAKDELIGSTVYGINLRALNGEIRHLDASTIQVSTLHASEEIDASTIFAVNMSSLNGLFVNISGIDVRTSTIGAVAISTSSLGVTQELDASTITSLNISSINGLFDNLRASTIIAENIEFSTINGNSIEVGEINVSTLTTSSIMNDGFIVSRGQIRASGPSGQRTPITVGALTELDVSDGPFFYLVGNGNYVVTCENFNFCDQMYIQTNGNGILTFSTGFSVSEPTMSTSEGMIHFICDGFHMVELGRSRWLYNY